MPSRLSKASLHQNGLYSIVTDSTPSLRILLHQHGELVDIHGAAPPVDLHQDRQPDGRLRRRDGEVHEHEDVARAVAVQPAVPGEDDVQLLDGLTTTGYDITQNVGGTAAPDTIVSLSDGTTITLLDVSITDNADLLV